MGTLSITVEHDIASIPVFLDAIATQAVKKAVATSIKRTFTTLKKEVAGEINRRKVVNTRSLPQREIKRRYIRETQHASANMPISDMEARLDFSKRKISIMHFWAKRIPVFHPPTGKAKRGKRALGFGKNQLSSVEVKIMGKTQLAAGGHAFMPGSTGLRAVLIRKTRHRMPIRLVVGPSMATMFEKMDIAPSLQRATRTRYSQEFEHQFAFYLKQLTDRQASKSK